MSLLGNIAKIGLAPVTGGASLLAGEDTLARIPVVGALTGSKTKAQKRLVEEQKRMAADMRKRSAMNERARLNAMQQKLGALAPLNQAMAQMYGPDAADSPEQFAQMGANPFGPYKGVWGQGTDEERRNQVLVFSNDGKQLLMTIGEANVAGNDQTHLSRPQDLAFMPDGAAPAHARRQA